MSSPTDDVSVMIDNECFSITEKPGKNTALVLSQKEDLLGSLDLPALVDDLGRVGTFIRIAYNGVATSAKLQILIREIGVDITKLCDKSAVTVSKFKNASSSVLEDLQGTYQFLLDGLEDIALVTLADIADVAKDMASAASELQQNFNDEMVKVEKAWEETTLAKESEEKNKAKLQEKANYLEVRQKSAQRKQENAEKVLKLAEVKYKEAESKQESLEASATEVKKGVVNFFTTVLTGRKYYDTDSEFRLAQEAREEKLMHWEDMKKQLELRCQSLQDLAEFSKKIEHCQQDTRLAQVAIDALKEARGGLQHLSKIMSKAALFWNQIQAHCQKLANEKMKKMIERTMTFPKSERISVWTSTSFKQQAVRYYGRWVALDDVCAIYMHRIQETQKDLYKYLTENPTTEEAMKKVRILAAAFEKDLNKERKAIADRIDKGEQKMRQIKQEN